MVLSLEGEREVFMQLVDQVLDGLYYYHYDCHYYYYHHYYYYQRYYCYIL